MKGLIKLRDDYFKRTEFHHINIRRSFKWATLEEESQKGRSVTATTNEVS